jgi:hypothetical protein
MNAKRKTDRRGQQNIQEVGWSDVKNWGLQRAKRVGRKLSPSNPLNWGKEVATDVKQYGQGVPTIQKEKLLTLLELMIEKLMGKDPGQFNRAIDNVIRSLVMIDKNFIVEPPTPGKMGVKTESLVMSGKLINESTLRRAIREDIIQEEKRRINEASFKELLSAILSLMEDWEDGGTELPGFVQTDDASKKKVEIGATKMVQLLKAAKIISPAASEAMNELLIQLFAAANVLSPSQLRGVQKQIVNMMKNPVKKAATEKQKKAAAKEEPEQDKTIVDPAKSAQGAANAEVDRRVA